MRATGRDPTRRGIGLCFERLTGTAQAERAAKGVAISVLNRMGELVRDQFAAADRVRIEAARGKHDLLPNRERIGVENTRRIALGPDSHAAEVVTESLTQLLGELRRERTRRRAPRSRERPLDPARGLRRPRDVR